MKKTIAVLPGDGIGKEVMPEALKVLEAIAQGFNHQFIFKEALVGGAAWEMFNTHFPFETQNIAENADAILFGSVGGPLAEQKSPKWKECERQSILKIRQHFKFQMNLRPIKVFHTLKKNGIFSFNHAAGDIDILCIRELLGDVYFGEHRLESNEGRRRAFDEMHYEESQIEPIAHAAFQIAQTRRKKVTSVDKANVLACSQLWREIFNEVSLQYPDCQLEHLLVDNCAMQIIRHPSNFDVLAMPNLFGDILSDEASLLVGSLGMLPSASLNQNGFGLYEPCSGSAPDIAGKGIANPIGQILSAALMLSHSFQLHAESLAIEKAIENTLIQGYRTLDIAAECPRSLILSTKEMGDMIVKNLINNF